MILKKTIIRPHSVTNVTFSCLSRWCLYSSIHHKYSNVQLLRNAIKAWMICFRLLKMLTQNSFTFLLMLMVLPRSANESFVIADSFLTACSELGKGSGIVWPKWWNQVAHSLYRCFSCYLDKARHPILWSIWPPAMFFIHYPMRDAVVASIFM